jgi:hypothetical protein
MLLACTTSPTTTAAGTATASDAPQQPSAFPAVTAEATTNTTSVVEPTTTPFVQAANRPNPQLTPGATFPDVTVSQVCTPGYSRSVRNLPTSKKRAVFAEYGITNPTPGAYEIDHLIALELGGSNDITNLWPEPFQGPDNAHVKDAMENRLHAQVCAGALLLADAQAEIVHWWDFE